MDNSITKINCSRNKFFRYWLEFTYPLHKLQNKEIEILSYILVKRYELCKMITDIEVIDTLLFSREVKDQIIKESGESKTNFNLILSNLRKKKVLSTDNKLNKKFIPELSKGSNKFDFMIIFDINDTK